MRHCPYCGSNDVERFTRRDDFGHLYTEYYCNECGCRLSEEESEE